MGKKLPFFENQPKKQPHQEKKIFPGIDVPNVFDVKQDPITGKKKVTGRITDPLGIDPTKTQNEK